MKDHYDIMSGGMDQLIADIDLLKQQLIDGNNEGMKRVQSELETQFRYYASMVEIWEDYVAVVRHTNNIYLGIRQSSVVFNSYDKQATFAEYGYGIVGKNNPFVRGDIFGGDSAVGWYGYDIDTPHKVEPERYWWFKNKITFGAPSHPTYYKTFMWAVFNAPRIIGESIRAKIK